MNWSIFSILFLALFSAMLGMGIVVPLLPAYARDLGASGLYIGFIFGAFSFSRTIFLPYFGRQSDLKGRKKFITSGLFVYFIASIAFMFADNVYYLILIRFFQGIAAAMVLPVVQAFAGDLSPEGKEGTVMGILNISLFGGLSAGPVIGGITKDLYGMNTPFILMGIVCLIGFLSSVIFLPKTERHTGINNKFPIAYRDIIKNKSIIGLFLFRFAFSMCIGSIWAFAPLLAGNEFKMTSMNVGFLLMISVLISALLTMPMGFMADMINKRFLMTAGGVISALAMGEFYKAESSRDLYIACILIGIGGGISIPSIMAMTVAAGRKIDSIGSVMSFVTMGHSLGMIAGPIIAGIILDSFNMRMIFMSNLFCLFIAVILSLYFTSFSTEEKIEYRQ